MATTSLEVESLVAESPSKGVWSPAAAAASKWGGGIGWGSGGMGGLTEENESDEEEEYSITSLYVLTLDQIFPPSFLILNHL
jgi:hypothetical protein